MHTDMTPVFRKAVESDMEAIVALVQSAYRGDSSRQGWTTEADLLDGQRTDLAEVAEALAAPDSVVLLASVDGQLLAATSNGKAMPRTSACSPFTRRTKEVGWDGWYWPRRNAMRGTPGNVAPCT